MEAYGVCKERIDAVETALKAALDGAGVGASTAAAAQPAMERAPARAAGQPSKPAAPTSFEDLEDDIPF
ncbi:hypothetical protein [Caenimonas soli]|uniref:hypothetical protein n=1 Tax=Caenimonas soli TaxID=2735555 RepID=UPI0038B377D0